MIETLKSCEVHSTVRQEDDLDGWLAARKYGIGGSDIGAICGVSDYATPRLVYLKKTGQYEDEFSEASKERMYWGHVLEPVVADEFSRRTGNKIVEFKKTLKHKKYPWMLANIDRFIVDDLGRPIGVLECKTAGEYMNEDWLEGEIPLYYIYQLQWYLMVTGLPYGAFACLVGGNKFYYYEVYFNEELADKMHEAADKFWNYHVANLVEPPISGKDADTEYLAKKHAHSDKSSAIAFDDIEMDEVAETIIECKKQIKELGLKLEEATNIFRDKMGESESAFTPSYAISWKKQEQFRVDTEKLKVEYPSVYKAVQKKISFRKFSVK